LNFRTSVQRHDEIYHGFSWVADIPHVDGHVLHPVAGDKVYAGGIFVVTWTVDTCFSNINLYVLGGGYNVRLATNIENTGSWEWHVQRFWPSTKSLYMVLNTFHWNTNDEISTFEMISIDDQATSTTLS
jgi:hypothetical protein